MATLEIFEKRAGPVTVIKLSGHLVADEGDCKFEARVVAALAAGRPDVIVDLQNITYIDSGGVGALVAMYLRTMRQGGRLKLLSPSPRTSRVLAITHLSSVFEIFDREDDAVASFGVPVLARSGSEGLVARRS